MHTMQCFCLWHLASKPILKAGKDVPYLTRHPKDLPGKRMPIVSGDEANHSTLSGSLFRTSNEGDSGNWFFAGFLI